MAFTQGVAQTVHITTLDGSTPVAPTNPAVTVSLDGGATFEAPDNAAVTTLYSISLVLSAAETARAVVLVRVTADNADAQVVAFYFEDAYTTQRASNLDNADAKVSDAILASSGGSGIYTCTITVVDGDGNPVGSCPVRVSNSGGQLLGYSRSNASTGQVTFNLDAGEYVVTLGPLANYAPNNPHTLTVAGGTTADLTVTAISLPTPTDPGLCVVYADMRNAVGGQLLGAGEGSLNVIQVLSRPAGSTEVLADDGDNDAPALTDGSGRAALSIIRGAVVWIRATWPDGHTKTVQVTVPDEDAYDVGADL